MTEQRQVMVAGFVFSGDNRMLLVNKRKPAWQDQLWNAVGGKVEGSETPLQAMVREFDEETGVCLDNWTLFCTEVGRDYVVHFFKVTLGDTWHKWPLRNDAGEPLSWVFAHDVPQMACVGNLTWLVPLARDWRMLRKPVVVDFVDDIRENPAW